MRDVGKWYGKAMERVTVLSESQTDEIAEAVWRGAIVCDALTPGSELERVIPKVVKGTPYAIFVEAEQEVSICFVVRGPRINDPELPTVVVQEAALGMIDNPYCVYR